MDEISIHWLPVTDELRRWLYIEIQYRDEHSTDWNVKLVPPSANKYTIKKLLPNTQVLIKLRTVSESGAFGPVNLKAVRTRELNRSSTKL